jgi:hypothetical protein
MEKMGWRTMESAPTNGDKILLFAVEVVVSAPGHGHEPFITVGFWGGSGWCVSTANGQTLISPTRWMPLPAPPN